LSVELQPHRAEHAGPYFSAMGPQRRRRGSLTRIPLGTFLQLSGIVEESGPGAIRQLDTLCDSPMSSPARGLLLYYFQLASFDNLL